MATLKDIKTRISGVSSIETLTSAMKMVSSIKSRQAQKQTEASRPYYNKIIEMLSGILGSKDRENLSSPFLETENDVVKNVVIIVIAGDKGMCGSFNNNLFKYVDNYITTNFKEKYGEAKIHFILVGNKTIDYYKKREINILKSYEGAFQALNFNIVTDMHKLFIDNYINKEIDVVEVFYNRFVSALKQEPIKQQVLPVNINIYNTETKKPNIDYIFEPNKQDIFETILEQYIDMSIWQPLLESNAAEQTARLFAMDKATQSAQDIIKELQLQYNNARQAAITTEILEIVGGAEALKNNNS